MPYEDDVGLDEDLPRAPRRLRTADELMRAYPRQRVDLVCPDCGSMLVLKDGKYDIFYGCIMYAETGCKGAHNCHKHDATPFGVPADAKTRKARKDAHTWLDRLWKTGKMTRVASYMWLAEQLNVPPDQCHLGMFDLETCEKVITLVRHYLGEFTRFEHLDRNII